MVINFSLVILFVFLIFLLWTVSTYTTNNRENYRDPLWMQPHKLYEDKYSRANGSIYGTPTGGWDMFSGLVFYNNVL